MRDAPFGPIDPNSQHQLWSRWVFGCQSTTRHPSVFEVRDNARRFLLKLFQSDVGRVRCDEQGGYYAIVAEIEGPPAHDPQLVAAVRHAFVSKFLQAGFGNCATLTRFDVSVMAGDRQDGTPPEQWIVMPEWTIQSIVGGITAWPDADLNIIG